MSSSGSQGMCSCHFAYAQAPETVGAPSVLRNLFKSVCSKLFYFLATSMMPAAAMIPSREVLVSIIALAFVRGYGTQECSTLGTCVDVGEEVS